MNHPAPQNATEQYRPDVAAYNRPPAMPDYGQPLRQGQRAEMPPAGSQYSHQPVAPVEAQRSYDYLQDPRNSNADNGRGYPDNSRAYADFVRGGTDMGRNYSKTAGDSSGRTIAENSSYAQGVSPQSPSAADAKKAAYRYWPSSCFYVLMLG